MGAGPGRFQFKANGTRFRIFAHSERLGFADEVVCIDARPGSIAAGPTDDTIAVIDALGKPSYCSDTTGKLKKRPVPPYPADGPRSRTPAAPVRGHFAHIRPGRRAFSAAMAFAVVRITVEVWQHFFQRPIAWHFAATAGPVLQVHPRIGTRNAWSGDGYLEFGYPDWDWTMGNPFSENLEVIAHETGHLVMKGVLGTLPDDERTLQHRAHEESAADLIALVVAMQFESVIAHVLRATSGYLYESSLLSRIGEWGHGQADVERNAFNEATMASARADPKLNKHKLSSPFTGAVYDLLVEIFVGHLARAGAISRPLADDCRHEPGRPTADLSAAFARAIRGRQVVFAEALRQARDDLGALLAGAWLATGGGNISFGRVLAGLIESDRALGLGHAAFIREVFAARGIAPAPADAAARRAGR
jgi:hypothetical protein